MYHWSRKIFKTFFMLCQDGVSLVICHIYFGYFSIGPGQCRDSLRAGRCGDLIPVGARFSSPFHTGPGAPSLPPIRLTPLLFPGGKTGRGVSLNKLPSIAKVKDRVELYFYCPSWTSWTVIRWPLPLPTVKHIREVLFKNICVYLISHSVVCLFQNELSIKCDLLLPLLIFTILSFP